MSENILPPSTLSNTELLSKKPLEIESVINNYQIKAYVNEDVFGINYSARHKKTNKRVVIYEYFPSEISTREQDGSISANDNEADKENFAYGLKQFEQESETLQFLKHKNIADIKECFNDNGTAYRVTKYYQGQTLKQSLTLNRSLKKPPFSEKKLLNVVIPVLDALNLLDENDCLHRNICPENIFLLSDGNVPLLTDFGIFKQALAQKMGVLNSVLATPYAAKEVYGDEKNLNVSADIYALCATLYYAITYEEPISALERGKAFEAKTSNPLIPAIRAGKNVYRKEFLTVIDQGLAYLPKERPQTATEFKKLLIEQQYKNRKKASVPNKATSTEKKPSQISELILLGLLLFILVQKAVEKVEKIEISEPESTAKISLPPLQKSTPQPTEEAQDDDNIEPSSQTEPEN